MSESRTAEDDTKQKADQAGIMPSHGISLDIPEDQTDGRPAAVRHVYFYRIEAIVTHSLTSRSDQLLLIRARSDTTEGLRLGPSMSKRH